MPCATYLYATLICHTLLSVTYLFHTHVPDHVSRNNSEINFLSFMGISKEFLLLTVVFRSKILYFRAHVKDRKMLLRFVVRVCHRICNYIGQCTYECFMTKINLTEQ